MKKFILMFTSLIIIGAGVYFFFFRNKETDIQVAHVSEEVRAQFTDSKEAFVANESFHVEGVEERKELLDSFIKDQLIDDGAIITNFLPDTSQKEQATGHDLLSESAGYYLSHLALADTKEHFDSFYKNTKKLFYDGTQFSYRIGEDGKRYDVNASLDDLRIFRSLIIAGGTFDTDDYDKDLKNFSSKFIEHSTNNGLMVDFYDEKQDEKSADISLFYLDFKTLGYIYELNDIKPEALQYLLNIVEGGYLSDQFPLYQQKYNYEKKEYRNSGTINILESLTTIRYLAELGVAKQESIEFVKDNVIKGTLFNSYDLKGNPVDTNQSAASYALAALIGLFVEDDELYEQSIQVLKKFQITDKTSPIYGGIGDPQSLEVYSYNNLTTLIAFDF